MKKKTFGLTQLGRAVSFTFIALQSHLGIGQVMEHQGNVFTITFRDGVQFDVEIKHIRRKV